MFVPKPLLMLIILLKYLALASLLGKKDRYLHRSVENKTIHV